MSNRIELEIIVTAVVFIALIVITNVDFRNPALTGHVVLQNSEEGQILVQKLLRNELFSKLSNVKICIHIRQGEDMYHAYRIRQRGEVFYITIDTFYCEGKMNEDFVFLIEDYRILQHAITNPRKLLNSAGTDVVAWQSRYVIGEGAPLVCSDEIKKNYCPLITEILSDKQRKELGITCCDNTKNAKGLTAILPWIGAILKEFWWLIALVIISTVCGFGAMYVLGKDDNVEEDTLKQLREYITQAREGDFGDSAIRERLTEAGWEFHEIEAAFDSIREDHLGAFGERFARLERLPIIQKSKEAIRMLVMDDE